MPTITTRIYLEITGKTITVKAGSVAGPNHIRFY